MEVAIDAGSPIDHIEFQIVPSENRYEAWVCYKNNNEKVASGLLEHLLLHSDETKALHSKGSNAKYKLCAPENLHDIKWFTKSTLIRFLHIIGSPDILDVTNSLKNEIYQLEEARRFHLSIYAKDSKYSFQNGQSDDSFFEGRGPTTKGEGSDASKNELLRAMDLRLTALREELTTALDRASGSRYSVEEMTDIHKFSQHFGSKDLSDSLCKYIEMREGDQAVENTSSSNQFSDNSRVTPKEGNKCTDNKSSSLDTQVEYGVSRAKVAQVERQSSTESGESSFSSDEDRQPSAERSRTLIRSASPRRSASPMRRVRIGRSGSRRSAAITIKSLSNNFPARERSFFPKDEDDSGEEGPKKSENDVRRMSVQDAINLFESKQRNQTEDNHKAKSLLNANKSVLRRWSSGMGEDSSQSQGNSVVQGTDIQNNVENGEVKFASPDYEAEPIETREKDVKLESLEIGGACSPVLTPEEPRPTESTNVNEKSNASAEWNRQKEAELSELFTKMMETKPIENRSVSKRQSSPSEQRGGCSVNYKEKRSEKLKVEAIRKGTENEEQSRSRHQVLDIKSKLTSTNESGDSKKNDVKKLQKAQKSSVSQPANPKTEKSPKLSIVKKDSPKASSLLATRKSWPSIPSDRATGLSPAKTPPPASSSTNETPTRRRLQPAPQGSQSSSKVEAPRTRVKPVKPNRNDSKTSLTLRSDSEKNQQSLVKPKKAAKTKVVQTAPKDLGSSTKPKVTKKSSVMPLESKPFLRKSSKTTSAANPSVTKEASHLQKPLTKSEDLTPPDESLMIFNSSKPETHQEEKETGELEIHADMEPGPTPRSPQNCEDEGFNQIRPRVTDNGIDLLVEPEIKAEAEDELTISPRAWVDMDENEVQSITSVDQVVGFPADIAPVEVPTPQVRHSLSQMLLQESSEPDFIDWGNAENPLPPMVYQKDAPKGLKRLLKFARKSKNEANTTGWSSLSVFSEGEDDGDDSKLTNKRSAENLLKKATLHSMNNGHQKSSTDCEHPAQPNINKLNVQSLSQQFQPGHVSASVTTTKATRSFFSLSAFKGGK